MCWFVGFVCSYLRIVSILLMMWIGVHRALVIKYPFHKKISENGAKVSVTQEKQHCNPILFHKKH